MGVRGVLVYCADYRCSHSVTLTTCDRSIRSLLRNFSRAIATMSRARASGREPAGLDSLVIDNNAGPSADAGGPLTEAGLFSHASFRRLHWHHQCRLCAWSVRSEHHLGQRTLSAQTGRTSDSKRSGQKSATILTSGGRPHLQSVFDHHQSGRHRRALACGPSLRGQLATNARITRHRSFATQAGANGRL